jgi:hypothetical protein
MVGRRDDRKLNVKLERSVSMSNDKNNAMRVKVNRKGIMLFEVNRVKKSEKLCSL